MSIATAYLCPPPPCPPLRLSRIWHERRLRTASPICSALRQPRPGVGGGGAASRQAHQGVGAGRVTAIWKTWCGSRCRSPKNRDDGAGNVPEGEASCRTPWSGDDRVRPGCTKREAKPAAMPAAPKRRSPTGPPFFLTD
jgi:hypothetical protein